MFNVVSVRIMTALSAFGGLLVLSYALVKYMMYSRSGYLLKMQLLYLV